MLTGDISGNKKSQLGNSSGWFQFELVASLAKQGFNCIE